MTTNAALLQLTAELALFLVAVVGVTFALRPRVLPSSPSSRSLLGAGFLATAVAAMLRGALLVDDAGEPALVVLRVGGLLLLALGAPRLKRQHDRRTPPGDTTGAGSGVGDEATTGPGRRTKVVLWAGLVALVFAELLSARHAGVAGDAARLLGALLLGGALFSASRRSIGARIGADSAVLLLVVLLAVSVALSVVVTRNVENEALRRYGSRGASEAASAVDKAKGALGVARLVSGEIGGGLGLDLADLASASATSEQKEVSRQRVSDGLAVLVGPSFLDVVDPVVVVDPSGVPEAVAPAALDNTTRLALAAGPVAEEGRQSQGQRQAVTVVGDRAYAVAVAPIVVRRTDAAQLFVGEVVVATPLDATYLRAIDTGSEAMSLALVTPDRVLATSGTQPPPANLRAAAREVVQDGRRPSEVKGSRFVVARPVVAQGGEPDLALVVSVPTSAIESTRNALFRALFLIALGAALVAVVLAVAAGERIGQGIRKLTLAAQRIRQGDLTTTSDVYTDDELGTLGNTFDTMAGSLRQAEDMKTSFLSNISHELRTPLTPIKGYAAALRRRQPSPEQAALFADEIATGVDQLERVISQLVNFATMAAGRLDLCQEVVSSEALLQGVTERWAGRMNGSHQLRTTHQDGLPQLEIDSGYVDQALDELVDNAIKYSPGGGPVVVSAGRREGNDRWVWLSVTDEGVGMDSARVEQLTAEFAQADGSATRRFGGLGLGLALAERIARAHGGELRCRSGEQGGTEVSILVPVCRTDTGGTGR